MFDFLVFEEIHRKLATAPLSHISDELVIHCEIPTRLYPYGAMAPTISATSPVQWGSLSASVPQRRYHPEHETSADK